MLFFLQMKQPDLYERMKEVKLLVDEKRVDNVELLQQELDLLHQGLKQEAAKGTSRRRTRGGPVMAAEAAAALKEGEEIQAASFQGVGSGGDEDEENEEGEQGKESEGQGSGQVQDSQTGQLVEVEVPVAAASPISAPKATLQRGGRNKNGPAETTTDNA